MEWDETQSPEFGPTTGRAVQSRLNPTYRLIHEGVHDIAAIICSYSAAFGVLTHELACLADADG